MARWQNEDPIVFQLWKNNNYKKRLNSFKVHSFEVPFYPNFWGSMLQVIDEKKKDLNYYKRQTLKVLFPAYSKEESCVAMLLTNMAYPEWINVPCERPLVDHIFCLIEENRQTEEQIDNGTSKNISNFMLFKKACVIIKNTCYVVFWIQERENLKWYESNELVKKPFNIELFEILFDAVDVIFPPVISYDMKYKFTYEIYDNYYHYEKQDINGATVEGLYFNPHKEEKFILGNNLFKCENQVYISFSFVCNGEKDCPDLDHTDEKLCFCNNSNDFATKCKYIIQKDIGHKKCSPFYYIKIQGMCNMYNSIKLFYNNGASSTSYSNIFVCADGTIIDRALVNDLVPDCAFKFEDEDVLHITLTTDVSYECDLKYQIPC